MRMMTCRSVPLLIVLSAGGIFGQAPTTRPANEASDPVAKRALDMLERLNARRREETAARNHYMELQNAVLERKIAVLEGRTPNEAKVKNAQAVVDADRGKGLHPEAKVGNLADLDALILNIDCADLIIDLHNRRYPKEQWAGLKDIAELLGGPIKPERTIQAQACAETALREAQKMIQISTEFQKR